MHNILLIVLQKKQTNKKKTQKTQHFIKCCVCACSDLMVLVLIQLMVTLINKSKQILQECNPHYRVHLCDVGPTVELHLKAQYLDRAAAVGL